MRLPQGIEHVSPKLNGYVELFLGFELNWLRLLPEDRPVEGAVLKRAPLSKVFHSSVASRYIAKLVSNLDRYVETLKPARHAAKDNRDRGNQLVLAGSIKGSKRKGD